ncbi:hypothetical protein QJS66_02325 [Kocuria rhizophila]|nr:hypothetical protein QJS66_02325 [Kocuria rhizophila]
MSTIADAVGRPSRLSPPPRSRKAWCSWSSSTYMAHIGRRTNDGAEPLGRARSATGIYGQHTIQAHTPGESHRRPAEGAGGGGAPVTDYTPRPGERAVLHTAGAGCWLLVMNPIGQWQRVALDRTDPTSPGIRT